MARFVKQKSDVAQALDRIQGFADNLITMETNRRIQLGREKEARVSAAYGYMIGEEEKQVAALEDALDLITTNLRDKGVELTSVKPEFRSIAAEELLTAAGESAMQMGQVRLDGSKDYRDRLEKYKREADQVLRNINLFDDAVSLVDPGVTGKKHVVEAGDVADAALDWMTAMEEEGPEIMQRLKKLQTEGELERLQEDYYARLAKESQEKITASTAGNMDAKIKIETLEPVKKEAQEAVKALTYQPVSKMVEEYGVIISRQADIDADPDMKPTDLADMEDQIAREQARIGSILFPWSYSAAQASVEAQGMQTALTKAVKNGDYYDLVSYFKKGNAQYKLLAQEGNPLADTYRSDIQSMFGIDIASDDWVNQLIEMNEISARIDIEQATEAVKIGRSLLPEAPIGSENEEDELLKRFLEGSLSD